MLTPIKSIRAKCLDCMGGSSNEVKLCTMDGKQSTFCPLYPYRMGKRPTVAGAKKRIITDEQKEKMMKGLEKHKSKTQAS